MLSGMFSGVNPPTNLNGYIKKGETVLQQADAHERHMKKMAGMSPQPVPGVQPKTDDSPRELYDLLCKIREQPIRRVAACDDIKQLGRFKVDTYSGNADEVATILLDCPLEVEWISENSMRRKYNGVLVDISDPVALPDLAKCCEYMNDIFATSLCANIFRVFRIPLTTGGEGLFVVTLTATINLIPLEEFDSIIADIHNSIARGPVVTLHNRDSSHDPGQSFADINDDEVRQFYGSDIGPTIEEVD